MVLSNCLFYRIALQDQSGRVNWLLLTVVKSYAFYVRKNKGVLNSLVKRFIRHDFFKPNLFLTDRLFVEDDVYYLPSGVLHGTMHEEYANHKPTFEFGRLISYNCCGKCFPRRCDVQKEYIIFLFVWHRKEKRFPIKYCEQPYQVYK